VVCFEKHHQILAYVTVDTTLVRVFTLNFDVVQAFELPMPSCDVYCLIAV
jgi:hypothetical protein